MQESPDSLVLLKSLFIETTRGGKYLCYAVLALTPRALLISSCPRKESYAAHQDQTSSSPEFHYPLESTKLKLFKKSRRQSIKVCFDTLSTKYFELGESKKRQIFWKLWCSHVSELSREQRIWPFIKSEHEYRSKEECLNKINRLPWTDKYLYLGSKRAAEDIDKPKPIPGLGPTEDIKLLYLKQKYFGCWDQSEHWVQCGNSSS